MNKRKAKKLKAWCNYLVGFSGSGPSLLDTKPSRKLGRKELAWMRTKGQRIIDFYQKERWKHWRQSCIEILGEDPDDEDW